ncbi:MAG: alpha-amylase family glycosyl hydrolase, partial [Microcoleaceae cyanobacterium]
MTTILTSSLLTNLSSTISATPKPDVYQKFPVINNNQQIYPKTNYLQRDIRDDVFYFVLPDRFFNGNASNDQGAKEIGNISHGGYDPTNKGMFHGGDLVGLTSKLPYLKNMGITAIWLTPILRNSALQGDSAAYHGYWILDFTEVDPHLGTKEDLKKLIDTAHALDMKIFFDIVINHTADIIKYKECHGADGKSSVTERGCPYVSLADKAAGKGYHPVIPAGLENAKAPAWLNDPKYYNNQGESTITGEDSIYGDFFGLDDVNTDDLAVVKGMIDIFQNLITEFKPDGFRIDTVRHINMEFWQQFVPAVINHAKTVGIPNFFVFGEIFDTNPEVLSKFTTEGKFPSVLDFGFYKQTENILTKNTGTDAWAKLFAQDIVYQDNDSDASLLMNFISNHDAGRFAHYLHNAMPNISEEERLQRVNLAHALMYFMRGVPIIYYGDEQGFVGDGNDKDAREDMMPSQVASYNDNDLIGTTKTTADDNFDMTHPIYLANRYFASLYQQLPALRYGTTTTKFNSNQPGIYAFTREVAEQKCLVALNTNTAEQKASFTLPNWSLNAIISAS